MTLTEDVKAALLAAGYTVDEQRVPQLVQKGTPDSWGELAHAIGAGQAGPWSDARAREFYGLVLPACRVKTGVDVALLDRPDLPYTHRHRERDAAAKAAAPKPKPKPKAKAVGRCKGSETVWSDEAKALIRKLSKKKRTELTADDFQDLLEATKKSKGVGQAKATDRKPKLFLRLAIKVMDMRGANLEVVVGDFESQNTSFQTGTDAWKEAIKSLLQATDDETLFPRMAAEAHVIMFEEVREQMEEQQEQSKVKDRKLATELYERAKLATKPAETRILMCAVPGVQEDCDRVEVFKRLVQLAHEKTDGGVTASLLVRADGADLQLDCDLEIEIGQTFIQFTDTFAAGVFKGIMSVNEDCVLRNAKIVCVPAMPTPAEDGHQGLMFGEVYDGLAGEDGKITKGNFKKSTPMQLMAPIPKVDSTIVLIKKVIKVDDETKESDYKEVCEDVKHGCSAHGSIVSAVIVTPQLQGQIPFSNVADVFLEFEDNEMAGMCIGKMTGRKFDSKPITIETFPEAQWAQYVKPVARSRSRSRSRSPRLAVRLAGQEPEALESSPWP